MTINGKCVLSDAQRILLNEIQSLLKLTSDEIECHKYNIITRDYAQGYLECFLGNASDDKILMSYFIIFSLCLAEKFEK